MRLIKLSGLFVLLALAGCSSIATYNPRFDGAMPSVASPSPGKALVYMSEEDSQYAFSGSPTSFTGGGSSLTIHLGEMTRRLSTKAFAAVFENGADYSQTLDGVANYTVVVKPSMRNFSYAYNQLKNAGMAITPQVDMGVEVEVLKSDGTPVLRKNYSSGLADGETYFMTGSPGEEISKAAHKVLTDLLGQAAKDTHAALYQQAISAR